MCWRLQVVKAPFLPADLERARVDWDLLLQDRVANKLSLFPVSVVLRVKKKKWEIHSETPRVDNLVEKRIEAGKQWG